MHSVQVTREVADLMKAVQRVVFASAQTHPLRHETEAEAKSRVDYCLKMIRELNGDHQWSTTRIIDELPRILAAKLDGVPWSPARTTLWSPASVQ